MPPPPRYPLAEPLVGSGDLDFAGPVGAQVARDFRQRGFWAIINAQPDQTKNAYGFIRADDFDPTTFAQLVGAIEQGDGTAIAAWEVGKSLTVPTDGSVVVWLEPLRVGAGYSFKYNAASSGGVGGGGTVFFSPYSMISTDTWENATAFGITLPSAGTYTLFGQVTAYARASAISSSGFNNVAAHLFNQTNPSVVVGSGGVILSMQAANVNVHGTYSFVLPTPYTVATSTFLQLQVNRTSNVTWSSTQILATLNEFGGDNCTSLGYLKIG